MYVLFFFAEGASCVFPILNSCNQICNIVEKDTVCGCVEEFFEMTDDNRTCSEYIIQNNFFC